jgi:hypothetical protein
MRRPTRILRWAAALLLLASAAGCGRSRTAHEAAADLGHPEAEVRMRAARDIEGAARDQKGLPPDITEQLLGAFGSEQDPKTRGAIITALGYTGDPRVKPLLDQYCQTTDHDQQRWGSRAYKKWVVAAGQMPPDHKFEPEMWPFGTPGFPPPAPKPD